ncbi:hypothetical protein FVEN_g5203 [Fusarium venenatum]|uniref:Uncharacterized protein n=1 Tax=Fusarium venenatum TaxID=56646 RepID=A0A2L2TI16_9HYPO|nr:uncharacterized protein FVRRES_07112 [Fusarium venenatum]KAG8356968.1 hypothetical protein FVEN_g5203 [Fusarium venenatum]KAH6994057.1 hypothetical protein EDB82DRAFT_525140 [Fusarium venenatum]CEI62676.1 unnamed protein product [Fusarium venenatum]
MVIGNHDASSDSELNANTLQTRSLVLTPRQESQDDAPELEHVPIHDHIEERIVLSGDEDDLVVIDTQTVDAVVEFAAVSQTAQLNKRSWRKTKAPKDSQPLTFDNTGMVEVAEDHDPEEDYFEHRAKQERPNLLGYDAPIGPFNSEEYEKNPSVDNEVSLFHKIPGVQTAQRALSTSTHLAQSSISNVTESVVYTSQQTRQARQYFADSVLNAGQGVMIRVQESWAIWPRGINGGIQTISQFVMEGVQSLPPLDIIIRPQGRQMHGQEATRG